MSDTEQARARVEAVSEAVKPMHGTRRELRSSALWRYLAAEQRHAVSEGGGAEERTGPPAQPGQRSRR